MQSLPSGLIVYDIRQKIIHSSVCELRRCVRALEPYSKVHDRKQYFARRLVITLMLAMHVPCCGACDGLLPILGEATASTEPAAGALNHPSAGQNLKAVRCVGALMTSRFHFAVSPGFVEPQLKPGLHVAFPPHREIGAPFIVVEVEAYAAVKV